MQKAKKTMPSRTGIPPDAQAEILQKLSAETKITSCEIAEILKKHDVCGDMDALQDAYRKRLGQRLLSGIRDENGKREILSTSGGEYVIVCHCVDAGYAQDKKQEETDMTIDSAKDLQMKGS